MKNLHTLVVEHLVLLPLLLELVLLVIFKPVT